MKLRRATGPIAALAAAALLAGCGTASSGGSTGSSTTAGTSTTSTNQFNPNLVPAGGSSPGAPPKAAKTKPAKRKAASKAGSKSNGGGQSSAGSNGSTGGGSTGGGTGSGSGSSASGGGTQTVTVTHTNTVTHTVTKYVRPDVPAGAGLPSRSAALSVSTFDAAGGNIGCRISNGTVRCDVGHRVWSPPRRPASCRSDSSDWGQGLMVGPSGRSFFVCARSSVLDPTGTYIRPGYDDKVGSVTCQVRNFGVTCFEADGSGFFIGHTGYTRF